MLAKRALGFPSPVFLVVVVVVPVIVLVLRRKWQQSVARSEEVRRLLVSASEESTRVEFEAREAYYYSATATPSARVSIPSYASAQFGSPLKPPYQCAVCFRPTTTRCAKCKAVRYCSGKCQIVHWRQGHKEECRPYVAVTQVSDVGGSSNSQRDHKDYSDSFDTEAKQTATPAELKSPLSYEGHSVSSTPTNFSAGVTFENFETVKSVHGTLVSPARKSTGCDNKQKKSILGDEDTQSGISNSSLWTDDAADESSSLSEPSTKSFGFWDGKIPNKKSSINEHDDISPASVGEAEHGQLANQTTKVNSNSNIKDGFCAAKAMDGSGLGGKKSNDITDLPKGMVNRGFNSNRPPTCTSGMLNHKDRCADSDLPTFNFRESKNAPAYVPSHHASSAARHLEVLEKSDDTFCNKRTVSDMSKSMDVVSPSTRDSDTYSTTATSRNISPSTKHGKVVDDDNHRIATCSFQLTDASKFRESKNYPSNVPSNRAFTAARDTGSSSLGASNTHLTTVTSAKPAKVVDDVSHRTTTSSQLAEASRRGVKTSKLKVVDYLKTSKLSQQESFEGGSDTTHNYSFKGLFSYEKFIKLYNWKQVALQPCGLKNCGNSCYANAVLQCLMYTPPLTAYLLEGVHSKACEKRGWCFTCEFEGLVRKAKDGISPLSPIRILTHIENVASNLGHGKEEDAHEFLRYVIDALQSVCIEESGKKSLNSLEEETTLIGLTFGGYLRSKIICMKCGGKSEQHERMMDLTVEIQGDVRTLEEALDKFTCTEILDGENKYKCNRCKSYEKAKKKFTLLEAPNVLTITLKRFQSGKFGKLNKSIHFPEILDMAPYVSGTSDKSPIYSLYGVVVHVDTMNATFSGHYISYVKNLQNQWFKFDDSMVKEVDLQHVLTEGAYMLLYARCSPRAPRSIRSSIIHHHHDPRKHKKPPLFVSKCHSVAQWDACSYHPPHVHHRSFEEESSSSDNSGFFSESCSCSTESTHRDSTSIEDHISGDWEPDYHRNINLNSSDSDTSSSSSFPSPLYSRLSQLYSSTANGEEDHKVRKLCRNSDCSCNNCSITNMDRLGGRATYLTSKPSVTFRRSTTRGKSD